MAIRFQRSALVAGATQQAAAEFAAEISTYLTESMGIPTTWGFQIGGSYGRIHWFVEYADMTEFEAGVAKTMTDPGYLAILAKATELFVDGETEDSIIYLM